jgi:hypothetical protein
LIACAGISGFRDSIGKSIAFPRANFRLSTQNLRHASVVLSRTSACFPRPASGARRYGMRFADFQTPETRATPSRITSSVTELAHTPVIPEAHWIHRRKPSRLATTVFRVERT